MNFRTVVRTQAESMVSSTQDKFDQCLKAAESKIPTTTPFVDQLNNCPKQALGDEYDEIVAEENVNSVAN